MSLIVVQCFATSAFRSNNRLLAENLLIQVVADKRLPMEYITQRLQTLDRQLKHLENQGRTLEESIRGRKNFNELNCCTYR